MDYGVYCEELTGHKGYVIFVKKEMPDLFGVSTFLGYKAVQRLKTVGGFTF